MTNETKDASNAQADEKGAKVATDEASDHIKVFESRPYAQADEPSAEADEASEDDADDSANDEAIDDAGDNKDEKEPKAKRKRPTFQERINELTADKRQAQREAEYWREKAMQGLPQSGAAQAKAEDKDPFAQPPNPNDYAGAEYDPEYIAALTDYRVEIKLREREASRSRFDQQQAERDRIERAQAAFQDRLREQEQYASEIEQLANDPAAPVSSALVDLAIASDHGMAVLAHLNRNRAELARISQMPPYAIGYEFSKLEAQIAAKQKLAAAKQSEPVGSAPSVGTKSPVAARDPRNMSQVEYEQWANQRAAERAKTGW